MGPDLPFGPKIVTSLATPLLFYNNEKILKKSSSVKFCVGVDLLIDYHVDPGTTGWVGLAMAQECYLRS